MDALDWEGQDGRYFLIQSPVSTITNKTTYFVLHKDRWVFDARNNDIIQKLSGEDGEMEQLQATFHNRTRNLRINDREDFSTSPANPSSRIKLSGIYMPIN
ncbi:predicted protein [Sclerotinia sclerotiorum 1980 UF-70]|uniref:Uncharacterized protein n=1 Tax=Sclerotinia sclerotiorum (strain ATCC 18683 / 1980 / Ss-1) TaxID=665079 RepID=A7E447_SCLS1|nr:predicted protein [Sclerotinia sclerotiorum 1980 UF-70]EDN90669.1 predicted protein [Sclerotinia sclerotiorum 1980 UF-70]